MPKPFQRNKNTTRFFLPFTIKCIGCDQYIFKNKRYNTVQEEVKGGDYYGIKVYRFIFKCSGCKNTLSIKTDPKNGIYVAENGCIEINETHKKVATYKNEDKSKLEEVKNDIKKLFEIEKRL